MMLKEIQPTGKKDTRSGFGDGIAEIARKNKDVVALTADLAGSLKLQQFMKEFPERFIQVGIAEANMMGIAAGLTIGGKIPYTTTFANFSTGRVYDQIRQSIAYSGKNVKICASHAGVTLGEDGATHQILEDIGLMKMLPGMTVIVPCDYNQTKAATIAIADHTGPVYLRFGRPSWPIFTNPDEPFVIGKAQQFSEGTDVSIFACGHLVWNAIQAGAALQEKGISVEVINIHTIKPLDEEAVINSLRKTKCAVTAEEHNIIGGLGSAVCEVTAENHPVPVQRMGVADVFGESARETEIESLLSKYHLSSDHIVESVLKIRKRLKK